MSYSLFIHAEAESDAEAIASYIGERSYEGMLRWLDAYEAAQARLRQNPLAYGYAQEEPILGRGLRQILFKTPSGNRYRAVYITDGNRITILRVRGKGHDSLSAEELPN